MTEEGKNTYLKRLIFEKAEWLLPLWNEIMQIYLLQEGENEAKLILAQFAFLVQ